MKLLSVIHTRGWLPAGLVLNTRLKQGSDSEVRLVPALSAPSEENLTSSSMVVVPCSQADNESLIILKGRFMSPVLMGDLGRSLAPQIENSSLAGFTGGYKWLNPMSDPVVLLANALFEGDVMRYTGRDTPLSELNPDYLIEDPTTFAHLFTVGAPGRRKTVWEVTLPSTLYIPERMITSGVYGVTADALDYLAATMPAFQPSALPANMSNFYGEVPVIAPFNEFPWTEQSLWGMRLGYTSERAVSLKVARVEVSPSSSITYTPEGSVIPVDLTKHIVLGPCVTNSQIVIARAPGHIVDATQVVNADGFTDVSGIGSLLSVDLTQLYDGANQFLTTCPTGYDTDSTFSIN